jgi:hypothetical protein
LYDLIGGRAREERVNLTEHLLGDNGIRVGIGRAENLCNGGSSCIGTGSIAGLERLDQGRELRFRKRTKFEMVR